MNIKKYNFKIKNKPIGINYPTYFIADIAANHDGNIKKAIELINLAKESGADAVKFQHFTADTIVSKKTFDSMNNKLSHQKSWKKSVFDVYKDASLNFTWTSKLKKECDKINIDFFTSPYSLSLINKVNKYVCAYKVGSGDITWLEAIEEMAKKKKPIILATGASNLNDVKRAYLSIKKLNKKVCIMQCNTNYTASSENFKHINLKVLETYKKMFPKIVLGLSDHTPGHSTVLGAVTLGARMVEKHFTKSNKLDGPDHMFSMTPKSWKEMVERCRELEESLGDGKKRVELNELNTVVVQRRGIHLNKNLKKNHKIKKSDLNYLRPALKGSIFPYEYKKILNKKLRKSKLAGDILLWKDLK